MKAIAYKITLIALDLEGVDDVDALIDELERTRAAAVSVKSALRIDIEDWNDDHPLNKRGADIDTPFRDSVDEWPGG